MRIELTTYALRVPDLRQAGRQVRSSHYVVGCVGTSIRESLCIACLPANNCKLTNSRVHASSDCQTLTSSSGEVRMLKFFNKGSVPGDGVREFDVWEGRPSGDTTRSPGKIQVCFAIIDEHISGKALYSKSFKEEATRIENARCQ